MHHQLQIKIQSALLCCSTRFEEIHIFSHPISGTDVRGLFGTPPGETLISEDQWQVSQNCFGSPSRDV